MNKFKKSLPFILILAVIYTLFKYNYILTNSVILGTTLCLQKVFPMLFIMFIINDIIINCNLLKPLSNLINPLFNKIFNTTGSSSICFLLTIFSGTPSSAFILKEMVHNKKITINDANKLIAFTFFTNPLFLSNILSLSFTYSTTLKIIIIHYLANIVIGFLLPKKINNDYLSCKTNNTYTNLFLIIPSAIKKSLDTLLMILGTIIFYMIISNLIIEIIQLNDFWQIILKGFLEITQSLNALSNLEINSSLKEILAIAIISFGGLSIHTQVLSLIKDTEINYFNFLRGRILHVIISIIIYLLTILI